VQRGLDHTDQRPLARRQLVAHGVGEVRDAKALEPELHRRLGVVQAVQLTEQTQELHHPQPLRQREVAGGEADLGGSLAALTGEAMPDDLDPARVGGHDPEQHEQGRRLSSAVGPEERDALPRLDGEVEAVDGADALVLLHQPVGAQNGGRRRSHAVSVADTGGAPPGDSAASGPRLPP